MVFFVDNIYFCVTADENLEKWESRNIEREL